MRVDHGMLRECGDGLQQVTYPEPIRGWVLMELATAGLSPMMDTCQRQVCVAHDEREKSRS